MALSLQSFSFFCFLYKDFLVPCAIFLKDFFLVYLNLLLWNISDVKKHNNMMKAHTHHLPVKTSILLIRLKPSRTLPFPTEVTAVLNWELTILMHFLTLWLHCLYPYVTQNLDPKGIQSFFRLWRRPFGVTFRGKIWGLTFIEHLLWTGSVSGGFHALSLTPAICIWAHYPCFTEVSNCPKT